MGSSTHIKIVHSLLIIVLIIHTFASAAPLDGISTEDEEAYKRSMFIQRLMSVRDRLDLDKEVDSSWPASRDISPYIKQQKRYNPPLQGRSGGMSLCLWKVCPAAPWLVSKRRNL